MQNKKLFNFDNSYLSLPDNFFSLVAPEDFPLPKLFLLNQTLCEELKVSTENKQELLDVLLGKHSDKDNPSFAQAYAGHQFGNFTKLGDGRAIVIGEHVTDDHQRFDIQLKGSGKTPYSRGGDGKATLRAMLREYLISEAIHHLNIPTSRSLAIIKTGDIVYREYEHEGAALARVMKSHIRVGTFEYAAGFGSIDDLKALISYTANRLYPELLDQDNLALGLFYKVMEKQIDLVVNWMRIGFIHGVMNTDNTAISGETFDYGPCAFMNAFHPNTVYSSIDRNGRYAFGNQYKIIKWNLARFLETLLPVIDDHPEKAIALGQKAIDEFDALWNKKFYETMLRKIGVENKGIGHNELIDELLELMVKLKMDYTNTFKDLSAELGSNTIFFKDSEFRKWINKWKQVIDEFVGIENAKKVMRQVNPFIIPRNHLVEKALDEALNQDMERFEKLLKVLSNPYGPSDGLEAFMEITPIVFDNSYKTYCGT